MTSARDLTGRAAAVILVVGAMLLAYVGLVLADALQYRVDYHASESVVEHAVALEPEPLTEGEAIGEIRIDRLGLSEVIGQGESAEVLRRGVGHLADTAWLGQAGNVVLAGHRDTVFRALRGIQTGDRIDVTTLNRRARYEVQSTTVVSPDDLGVLNASEGNTLTLITCFPFGFIGAAPSRFVVKASEIR